MMFAEAMPAMNILSAYVFPLSETRSPWYKVEGADNDWAEVRDGEVILCLDKNDSSSVNAVVGTEKTVTSLSPSEQIAFVRESLSLNMSQLAELVGVTRPTVYAWLEGRERRQGETAGKIMRLATIAQKIERKNIPRADLLVKRPLFNGKNLLDLIKEGREISRELDDLKAIGDREAATRQDRRSYRAKQDVSRMEEVIDEVSLPIYFEEIDG